jgi:hypothetical protein
VQSEVFGKMPPALFDQMLIPLLGLAEGVRDELVECLLDPNKGGEKRGI